MAADERIAFYMDEHVSPAVSQGLRRRGVDVLTAKERGMLAALDLPLKVVVWADGAQTKVSYWAPNALAARHHLSPELAGRLAGIDALTDALVAP